MVPKHTSISEAFNVLGLEQSASFETVKTTYKQLALRTHPDKNPGNEEATAQFQKLSEAYNVLVKHLDPSRPSGGMPHRGPFGEFDEDDDDYDDYSDEDEYYYDDEEDEDLDFYMFLFEELLRGRANRYAHSHYHHSHPHSHPHVHTNAPMEEPYDPDRPRKDREAREAAEARRQRDAAARRAAAERERVQEKEEAERRQKAKAEEKKSKAAAKQEAAEKAARARQQRTQDLRSAVFAAARSRNAEKVRKGVWEDEVDAAGGEVRVGLESFAKTKPKDPKETLLHIAAYNGDVDLVEWLDTHNAEADGRNSNEMTAFHVALQRGHIPIVKYFFETYPVSDSDSDPVYEPPPDRALLLLAMESAEPEAVWLILDKKLASRKEIKASWEWLWSTAGQHLYSSSRKTGKLDEVKNILIKYGGFTAPPTPPPSSASDHAPEAALDSRSSAGAPSTQPEEPQPPTPTHGNKGKAKGGRGKRGGHQQQPSQSHIVEPPSSQPESSAGGNSRGGRGRGRGRGRGGRGRGQGRGTPPAQPAQ